MSKIIGSRLDFGVAKETTRGTANAPSYWLRPMDISVDEKVMRSMDEGRRNLIEDSIDSQVVGKFAEGEFTVALRDKSLGLLFYNIFGAVSSAVKGGEAVVYEHTYTVYQSNQHQSLCVHVKEANSGKDYALAMLDSMELSVELERHATAQFGFRAKTGGLATLGAFTVTIANPAVVTLTGHGLVTGDAVTLATTGALPTGLTAGTTYYVVYVTADTFSLATSLANALAGTKIETTGTQSGTHTATLASRYAAYVAENVFLPTHASVKFATNQAGLDAASAINVRSCVVKVNKNIEDDRALGNVNQVDIVNKTFSVDGEIELVYNDQTYVTQMLDNTTKALRLKLTNSDVTIGTASNPDIQIDLNKVLLEEVTRDLSKDGVVTQVLAFKAFFSETDSKMVQVILTNLATSY